MTNVTVSTGRDAVLSCVVGAGGAGGSGGIGGGAGGGGIGEYYKASHVERLFVFTTFLTRRTTDNKNKEQQQQHKHKSRGERFVLIRLNGFCACISHSAN